MSQSSAVELARHITNLADCVADFDAPTDRALEGFLVKRASDRELALSDRMLFAIAVAVDRASATESASADGVKTLYALGERCHDKLTGDATEADIETLERALASLLLGVSGPTIYETRRRFQFEVEKGEARIKALRTWALPAGPADDAVVPTQAAS